MLDEVENLKDTMHYRCEKAKVELARESQTEMDILHSQIKTKNQAMLTNL